MRRRVTQYRDPESSISTIRWGVIPFAEWLDELYMRHARCGRDCEISEDAFGRVALYVDFGRQAVGAGA